MDNNAKIFWSVLLIIIFGCIIKYLNDTVFNYEDENNNSKIDIFYISKLVINIILTIINLIIFFIYLKNYKTSLDSLKVFYIIICSFAVIIAVMYLFAFMIESVNINNDKQEINNDIYMGLLYLGLILMGIIVILLFGFYINSNLEISEYIDKISIMYLCLFIVGPLLLVGIIALLILISTSTNIAEFANKIIDTSKYGIYKIILYSFTAVLFWMICIKNALIIFKEKSTPIKIGYGFIALVYIPYLFIKQNILKFLHSCHSNSPYNEKYKFEL